MQDVTAIRLIVVYGKLITNIQHKCVCCPTQSTFQVSFIVL